LHVKKDKAANKPGSVEDDHLSRWFVAKPLVQPTRKYQADNPICCLVLLLTRFSLPMMLPSSRWALTPPFHPYRKAAVSFLWHSL